MFSEKRKKQVSILISKGSIRLHFQQSVLYNLYLLLYLFVDELHVYEAVCRKDPYRTHSAALARQHVESGPPATQRGFWKKGIAGRSL